MAAMRGYTPEENLGTTLLPKAEVYDWYRNWLLRQNLSTDDLSYRMASWRALRRRRTDQTQVYSRHATRNGRSKERYMKS